MVGTFNKTGRDGFTCIDFAFASKKKVAISISGRYIHVILMTCVYPDIIKVNRLLNHCYCT